MPTTQEVEHLKSNWRADPCYDLEDAEGFEVHRDELKAFRIAQEAEWSRQHNERLETKAAQLGCPGNTRLAAYVLTIEQRLSALEERI